MARQQIILKVYGHGSTPAQLYLARMGLRVVCNISIVHKVASSGNAFG